MVFQRNSALFSADLDGEVCLFDPATAAYLNLNATGSAIWKLLQQPRDEAEILMLLLSVYDVDPEICREHCQAFLHKALDLGLLELIP
jgi:hypothetical protein